MLDLIEGADDDADIAANSFNILSRLCDHEEGLLAVGKTKALEIAIEWLQNNMEDAPPEATAACMRLMEKLCPLDGTVAKLQVRNTAREIHCAGVADRNSPLILAPRVAEALVTQLAFCFPHRPTVCSTW